MVVDNSRGADARFAASIEDRLAQAGYEVELRQPSPRARFDTAVHFVVEGVAVRVPSDCSPGDLKAVTGAIRDAEENRSARQRYRAVPIFVEETQRVLRWVDVFG